MSASICSSSGAVGSSRSFNRMDASSFPRIAIIQQNNTSGCSRNSQPSTPTRIKMAHLSASSPGIHVRRLSTSHRDRIDRTFKRSMSIDVAEEGGNEDEFTEDMNGNNNEGCLYLLRRKDWQSKLAKIHLLSCKYVFVGVNMLSIAASVFYLFISNEHKELWTPTNSLLILGLIFGIILSAIAISGGIKEELYLVLTYSVIITIMITVGVIYQMASPVICLILVVTHVFVSFYYSLLLYRQPPSLATIILDPSDPVVNNLSSIRRKSMKDMVAQHQRTKSFVSSPSIVKSNEDDIETADRSVRSSSCDSPLASSQDRKTMNTKDIKRSGTAADKTSNKERNTFQANRQATKHQFQKHHNRPSHVCPMPVMKTTGNSASSLGSME